MPRQYEIVVEQNRRQAQDEEQKRTSLNADYQQLQKERSNIRNRFGALVPELQKINFEIANLTEALRVVFNALIFKEQEPENITALSEAKKAEDEQYNALSLQLLSVQQRKNGLKEELHLLQDADAEIIRNITLLREQISSLEVFIKVNDT